MRKAAGHFARANPDLSRVELLELLSALWTDEHEMRTVAIAIAEHLRTALVLDDHLAQTDPGRVAWFRELLLEVGARAQIVVLTCRPEDYLRDGEQPANGETISRQYD